MSKKSQHTLPIVVAAAAVTFGIGWSLRAQNAQNTPQTSRPAAAGATMQKIAIDKPVAAFSLPNYNGQTVTVAGRANPNTRAPKATVIFFVSTRCPVSNAYNARMATLAKTYGARGVRFVGINANKAEAPADIASHAKQNGFGFPVLKDSGNRVADRFEARVTPEAYVLDANGVLRYWGRIDDSQDEAGITSRDLQAALDAMLAGRALPAKKTNAFGCTIKRVEKTSGQSA